MNMNPGAISIPTSGIQSKLLELPNAKIEK